MQAIIGYHHHGLLLIRPSADDHEHNDCFSHLSSPFKCPTTVLKRCSYVSPRTELPQFTRKAGVPKLSNVKLRAEISEASVSMNRLAWESTNATWRGGRRGETLTLRTTVFGGYVTFAARGEG
jgi:hypothetical protein